MTQTIATMLAMGMRWERMPGAELPLLTNIPPATYRCPRCNTNVPPAQWRAYYAMCCTCWRVLTKHRLREPVRQVVTCAKCGTAFRPTYGQWTQGRRRCEARGGNPEKMRWYCCWNGKQRQARAEGDREGKETGREKGLKSISRVSTGV